ncbi:hypothetical protein GGX14DRAFT_581047 [Mycena pura]|uniref:Uncharacterized protein n=1 Tax=Mycena pura TaxID=153505 RepID=A0AAD6URM2_9AGAR|nr:hypothetical protein GGX14DRAFT_581047 [Mycena pura]
MSLPAVSIGLAGSILLFVLIGWISIGTNNSNPPLARLGLLQIIWIFEHHPELDEIFEQVDDPTDDNLRSAGSVNNSTGRMLELWDWLEDDWELDALAGGEGDGEDDGEIWSSSLLAVWDWLEDDCEVDDELMCGGA